MSDQFLEKEVALFALQYYRDAPTSLRNVTVTDICLVAALTNLKTGKFIAQEGRFAAFYNAWLRYRNRRFFNEGKNPVG